MVRNHMRDTVYKCGITHSWGGQERLLAGERLELYLKGYQITATVCAKVEKKYSNQSSLLPDLFIENIFNIQNTLDTSYDKQVSGWEDRQQIHRKQTYFL